MHTSKSISELPNRPAVYALMGGHGKRALNNLDINLIDNPLVGLIKDLKKLPYMFTLQCCYGHFLTTDDEEIFDFGLSGSINKVVYRLAYIAFCIENSPSGKKFEQQLKDNSLTAEQVLVQFCSAHWFWDQWLNSYVLQVMPQRFKDKDRSVIDFHEAEKIKQARDLFFADMKDLTSTIVKEINVSCFYPSFLPAKNF